MAKVVVGVSMRICPKTSRFGLTVFVETAPITLTVPPVIVVVVEIVLGIFTVNEGFVTKVEKLRGKLATLTLRLLLVTKLEKLRGKFATLTLRLLLVIKFE